MQGIKLGQGYGYALREMEVRNSSAAQPFGQNVGVDAMYEGNTYDNLHDGNMDTSTTLSGQGSFTFDLAKTYNIDRITFDHEQAVQGTYTVYYSTDSESWTSIDSSTLDKILIYHLMLLVHGILKLIIMLKGQSMLKNYKCIQLVHLKMHKLTKCFMMASLQMHRQIMMQLEMF